MTFVDDVLLVSNSEVQTFNDCLRRWWLGWYRGLVPKHVRLDGPRSIGTRIHLVLADLYDPTTSNDPLEFQRKVQNDDLERIIAAHQESLAVDDYDRYTVEVARQGDDFRLERTMLEGYLQWIAETGVDEDLEVLAVERYVEAPFELPTQWSYLSVKLIGKLDAKVRSTTTGHQSFMDHKTVGSLRDPLLGLNRQVLHYMVIDDILGTNGTYLEGALYNMLRKSKRTVRAKPPFYAREFVQHNLWEVANYKAQLTGIITRMEATTNRLAAGQSPQNVVPPRPSRDCSWRCDFFKICRMFDDGSRVEAAIDDLYEVRNPLDYYGDQIDKEQPSDI